MAAVVEGLDALKRNLERVARDGQRKITRAAVGAAMTTYARAARSRVNGSSAPPDVKAAARKSLGKRFRSKGNQTAAKVGFGVGKKFVRSNPDRQGRSGSGLSAANIHWAILGTKERHTGEKSTRRRAAKGGYHVSRKLTGNAVRSTGRMPGYLAGILEAAIQAATPSARAAAEQKAREALAKEKAALGVA